MTNTPIERLRTLYQEAHDAAYNGVSWERKFFLEHPSFLERFAACLSALEAATPAPKGVMPSDSERKCPQCGSPMSGQTPVCAQCITDKKSATVGADVSTKKCDHKFIDSKHCLKCGWEPPTALHGRAELKEGKE